MRWQIWKLETWTEALLFTEWICHLVSYCRSLCVHPKHFGDFRMKISDNLFSIFEKALSFRSCTHWLEFVSSQHLRVHVPLCSLVFSLLRWNLVFNESYWGTSLQKPNLRKGFGIEIRAKQLLKLLPSLKGSVYNLHYLLQDVHRRTSPAWAWWRKRLHTSL